MTAPRLTGWQIWLLLTIPAVAIITLTALALGGTIELIP